MAEFAGRLVKIFLYFLLLFAVCRLSFLLYFHQQIAAEASFITEITLIKGLPLDISTACYLLFLPLFLLFLAEVFRSKILITAARFYLLIISALAVVICIAEIGVYRELHTKLYYSLLAHLRHPEEVAGSVSSHLLFTLLPIAGVIIYACVFVLKRITGSNSFFETGWKHNLQIAIVFLAFIPLLVIGCRGGLQGIPINEAEVYFSHNQYLNDAAVNTLWSLTHSYIETQNVLEGQRYNFMDAGEADKVVRQLYSVEKDTTIHIFNVEKPNICFIILESWSAELVESLGGFKGLTPNFEQIARHGLLFTKAKPSGHISDQGITAILSGYPALTVGSVINQPKKQVNLPCINRELSSAGYSSSFFFGGQLIYGNIKAYIYRNNFNSIVEQSTLPSSLPAGKAGVHDSLMFRIWFDSLQAMQAPFLSCLFTLSTHSPFDEPTNHTITWGDMEMPYLNSVVYADQQLGLFFKRAAEQPWYNNTVFIIVADHSHATPKNYEYDAPGFYHIPLLITGGALKKEYQGICINKLCSQTDLASTLLHQLGLPASAYTWSRNILNPYANEFAYYAFEEGFGFIDTTGAVIWNRGYPQRNKMLAETPEKNELLMKKGSAMLQQITSDFNSK